MFGSELVIAVLVFVLAGTFCILSIRSFMNRGFLLNNAYLFASETDRKTMDKKPHYRQSAIVFLLLSIIFIIIGVSFVLQKAILNLLIIPFALAALIYAILSSIQINSK